MAVTAVAVAVDSDWVLADELSDSFTLSGDSDWVIADGDEGSVAAVFFASGGGASFSGRGRRLSFLPFRATAVASSGGRVLLRGPWSQFYTSDPATSTWAPLPLPPRPHSLSSAPADFAVVSIPPSSFRVIRAFHDSFEVYSPETATWQTYPSEGIPALLADSAVAALCNAYWKTADNSILELNPVNGEFRALPPPPGASSESCWQLGEARGKLCCAIVGDGLVRVYSLEQNDIWELAGSIQFQVVDGTEEPQGEKRDLGRKIECAMPPRPLRFESENLEVLLRVGPRRIVAVDFNNGWVRAAKLEGSAVLSDRDGDYVAYAVPAAL